MLLVGCQSHKCNLTHRVSSPWYRRGRWMPGSGPEGGWEMERRLGGRCSRAAEWSSPRRCPVQRRVPGATRHCRSSGTPVESAVLRGCNWPWRRGEAGQGVGHKPRSRWRLEAVPKGSGVDGAPRPQGAHSRAAGCTFLEQSRAEGNPPRGCIGSSIKKVPRDGIGGCKVVGETRGRHVGWRGATQVVAADVTASQQ